MKLVNFKSSYHCIIAITRFVDIVLCNKTNGYNPFGGLFLYRDFAETNRTPFDLVRLNMIICRRCDRIF